MRTLAIGDIHGCSLLLDRLLAAVAPTGDDRLIFLGDFIDRGPDSRGVVDRLIRLQADLGAICLRGNHDQWICRARTISDEYRMWMQVGGAQTLGSYGKAPGRSGTMKDIPEEHWQFLERKLINYYETDSHIFVHANLEPNTPLDQQTEEWLLWEFLDQPTAHVSGKIMVCGHTTQKDGNIRDLGTAIGIDTFAYGGGRLTCLEAHTRHYWQVDILGRIFEGDLPPRSSTNA
jgi:serine/threonine protein phosphatase 1